MCYSNITLTTLIFSLSLLIAAWFLGGRLPRPILLLLNIASLGVVLLEYRTIFDIEAGTSWLLLLQNLKLIENKRPKDLVHFYAVALLAAIAQALFTISLIGSMSYLLTSTLIFIGLFKFHNPREKFKFRLYIFCSGSPTRNKSFSFSGTIALSNRNSTSEKSWISSAIIYLKGFLEVLE